MWMMCLKKILFKLTLEDCQNHLGRRDKRQETIIEQSFLWKLWNLEISESYVPQCAEY